MYFSEHFMTIFRSNYSHLKLFYFYLFKIFVKHMLMYLTFSNLNSIHWIIKKDIGLYVLFRTFSGHFMTIFRSNYFHLRKHFLIFFLIFVKHMLVYLPFSNLNSIHWIIKKRYGPLCTFQDIEQVNFQDISVTHK